MSKSDHLSLYFRAAQSAQVPLLRRHEPAQTLFHTARGECRDRGASVVWEQAPIVPENSPFDADLATSDRGLRTSACNRAAAEGNRGHFSGRFADFFARPR